MQFLKKFLVCFHHHSLKQQLNITWNQYLDWYSNILLGTALFQLTQPWSQSKLIFSPLPCHHHLRCVNQESNNWHELEIQQRNIPKHLVKSIFHTTHHETSHCYPYFNFNPKIFFTDKVERPETIDTEITWSHSVRLNVNNATIIFTITGHEMVA